MVRSQDHHHTFFILWPMEVTHKWMIGCIDRQTYLDLNLAQLGHSLLGLSPNSLGQH
jgi:hypothetical protein